MATFRCHNCTRQLAPTEPPAEFDAPRIGPCPKCKAPVQLIAAVETIHYDPPSGVDGIGLRRAACNEAIKIGRAGLMMTGEPSAVTCRACKKAPVWKLNADLRGLPIVPPDADFEIEPPKPDGA